MEDKPISKKLKELREEKGYLQKFVADKIGVRSNTLSGYENGTRSPDPEMILKLAELYDVSNDYLIRRTSNRNSKTEDDIDEELKELLSEMNVWYKNEPEDKELKLRMLRKMIQSFEESDQNTNKVYINLYAYNFTHL